MIQTSKEVINEISKILDAVPSKGYESMTEDQLTMSALYASTASKLKPRGSNFTPPKKKRKKNK
jgi:hypothetical protein